MKIVADSSIDLYQSDRIKYTNIPIRIIGDKEYLDTEELDIKGMMDTFKKKKCKTSSACPNPQEFLDAFKDDDEIFVITVSKNLSGSYNSARIAKEECPDKKIVLIDPLTAGPEMTLYYEKIVELYELGYSFDKIVEALEEYKKHTDLVFFLESVNNFINNGRVSPLAGKAIGLLGLRLLGRASDDGKFEVIGKIKGKKKLIASIVSWMENKGYQGGKVIIHHYLNDEDANTIKQEILKFYPLANVTIAPANGLCSYYLEEHGVLVGYEN